MNVRNLLAAAAHFALSLGAALVLCIALMGWEPAHAADDAALVWCHQVAGMTPPPPPSFDPPPPTIAQAMQASAQFQADFAAYKTRCVAAWRADAPARAERERQQRAAWEADAPARAERQRVAAEQAQSGADAAADRFIAAYNKAPRSAQDQADEMMAQAKGELRGCVHQLVAVWQGAVDAKLTAQARAACGGGIEPHAQMAAFLLGVQFDASMAVTFDRLRDKEIAAAIAQSTTRRHVGP